MQTNLEMQAHLDSDTLYNVIPISMAETLPYQIHFHNENNPSVIIQFSSRQTVQSIANLFIGIFVIYIILDNEGQQPLISLRQLIDSGHDVLFTLERAIIQHERREYILIHSFTNHWMVPISILELISIQWVQRRERRTIQNRYPN